MQAIDGPDSSQLEWHQIGVKTRDDCVTHVPGTYLGWIWRGVGAVGSVSGGGSGAQRSVA
jgi:hypothetical protein